MVSYAVRSAGSGAYIVDFLGGCGSDKLDTAYFRKRVLCLLAAFALVEWTRSFVASGFLGALWEAFLLFILAVYRWPVL